MIDVIKIKSFSLQWQMWITIAEKSVSQSKFQSKAFILALTLTGTHNLRPQEQVGSPMLQIAGFKRLNLFKNPPAMQNCFRPCSLPCRRHSVSYVALWSCGTPVQKIISSEEHNGRAARQECDVTCWKQLCGWEHVNRCTSDHTDKGGKSSNTSLKVK